MMTFISDIMGEFIGHAIYEKRRWAAGGHFVSDIGGEYFFRWVMSKVIGRYIVVIVQKYSNIIVDGSCIAVI